MTKQDKQVKTIEEVISLMKEGHVLRLKIGAEKYACLLKSREEKVSNFVSVDLIDEMFDKDLLFSSSMTQNYYYYRLKGDE